MGGRVVLAVSEKQRDALLASVNGPLTYRTCDSRTFDSMVRLGWITGSLYAGDARTTKTGKAIMAALLAMKANESADHPRKG